MEGVSIVSKARTAFHSAAAKAEKVITEFKSDFANNPDHSDFDEQLTKHPVSRTTVIEFPEQRETKVSNNSRQFRWRPPIVGKKQEWQDRFRNIGRGKKPPEETEKLENPKMAFAIYDPNIFLYNQTISAESQNEVSLPIDGSDVSKADIIPPSSVLKQLATAIEFGKNSGSIKDLLASSRGSSPARERAALSLSAVKSLMRLEKEEKFTPDLGNDLIMDLIQPILDSEGLTPSRKIVSFVETLATSTSLPQDIHGAPPESLVSKLSEIMGSLKTVQKMAQFWCKFVCALRGLWLDDQYVPGIPKDELPDLNCCLLYQQLQFINCCISRRQRREIAAASLESLLREAGYDPDGPIAPRHKDKCIASGSALYAETSPGEFVLRLGADHPADNLTMLETEEPIYAPLTQEGPLLTEDLIREHEEFVLQTGSVGAGCSQLLSDMQAFKAANPGCVLEDFVRWHSPPDWREAESTSNEAPTTREGSSRGQLSVRMQKAGNLWRELWETAKPVPAVRQAPLVDEDISVEGILSRLEDISPVRLFEQLFLSLIGLGFIIAEPKLSTDENMSKQFYECKDYVVATCQASSWSEKVDDLCQVYETIEVMLVRPEEAMKLMKQSDQETPPSNSPKTGLRRLGMMFGGKGRTSKRSSPLTERKTPDGKESPARQVFSNFFDNKSSLFSKKPPKPESNTDGVSLGVDNGERATA